MLLLFFCYYNRDFYLQAFSTPPKNRRIFRDNNNSRTAREYKNNKNNRFPPALQRYTNRGYFFVFNPVVPALQVAVAKALGGRVDIPWTDEVPPPLQRYDILYT